MAVSIEVTLGFFLAVLLHNKATLLRGFFRSTSFPHVHYPDCGGIDLPLFN